MFSNNKNSMSFDNESNNWLDSGSIYQQQLAQQYPNLLAPQPSKQVLDFHRIKSNTLHSLPPTRFDLEPKEDKPLPAKPSNPLKYKTEICRAFEENMICRFGESCTFAHGLSELRAVPRHPRYKTELCKTYHTNGVCQYGTRCHFIHDSDENALNPMRNSYARHKQAQYTSSHHLSGTRSAPESVVSNLLRLLAIQSVEKGADPNSSLAYSLAPSNYLQGNQFDLSSIGSSGLDSGHNELQAVQDYTNLDRDLWAKNDGVVEPLPYVESPDEFSNQDGAHIKKFLRFLEQ